MKASLTAALVAASLWACALPEAHKVQRANGGGAPSGGGGEGGGGESAVGGGGAGGGALGFGNAIEFKNSCAEATVSATTDLGFATAAFTVEFWYRPTSLPLAGEYHVLMAKGGANTAVPGWSIYIATEGEDSYLAFSTSSSTLQETVATMPNSIVAGETYHFVVWRKNTEVQIWMLRPSLGQVVHIDGGSGAAVNEWVTAQPFTLGALRRTMDPSCDLNYAADGVMDEVRIFSRQRENAEFDADYDVPIPPASSELVAYWQMNEDAGNAMADSVTPAHQLTVSGTFELDYDWVPSPFAVHD